MEDVAKKSLPNDVQNSKLNPEANFRLHYFPDIPVDEGSSYEHCACKEEPFQRLQISARNSTCSDPFARMGGNRVDEEIPELSIEEIECNAYRAGFEEGQQKGLAEGTQEGVESGLNTIGPTVESLQQAIDQLQSLRAETYHDIEKELVELSLAIARKIVCHEVEINNETVVCVAREALRRVDHPGQVKIKLNPADFQFIEERKSKLFDSDHYLENVVFEAEATIRTGGCIVETEMGDIDARIENQLKAVEETFQSEFQNATREN